MVRYFGSSVAALATKSGSWAGVSESLFMARVGVSVSPESLFSEVLRRLDLSIETERSNAEEQRNKFRKSRLRLSLCFLRSGCESVLHSSYPLNPYR
jgi:hypothetical protein